METNQQKTTGTKNQKFDLVKFKNEAKPIAMKMVHSNDNYQFIDKILKIVEYYLQKPVIKDYEFFMKAKKVINEQMPSIVSNLKLPKILQQQLINYLTEYQDIPMLQKYVSPELLNEDKSLVKKNQNYFSITHFAQKMLTQSEGLEYAIDYICYVCGASDNISEIKMENQNITITVKDISKVLWSFDPENEIYKFSEEYLFNYWLNIGRNNYKNKINKKLFENIKKIVNIDYIDNVKLRLWKQMDYNNLNKITVKLVSADVKENNRLLQKLQQVVSDQKFENKLMKSTMKTIKEEIYRKNNWEKYLTLPIVDDERDARALYEEIDDVIIKICQNSDHYIEEIIIKYFNVDTAKLRRSNAYFSLYFTIELEIKKYIWNKIDEKVASVLLRTLYQVQENDPMNEMLAQYQINNNTSN